MGKELPSGTVTFLFSDIEGSTALLRDLGEGYDELLDLHHDALRDVWRRHGGVEVNTEGDAFFVAFSDASAALAAALDGQRALAAVDWPERRTVRVRMGLHCGYARPVADDYRALAVHQAARIVGAANGGQVFATADVVDAAGNDWSAIEVVDLGRYRVRDFDGPTTLYRISAPDVPGDGRPPRVRPADSHNLLRPATTLVNRVRELDELAALVQPGALTTLLGPGGSGKTRLSIELGFDVVDDWADGVWFVDLAPLGVGDVVPGAIAGAVSAPSTIGNDAMTDLLGHLDDRSMLLVLDNCEHLVDDVARVVDELRRRCAGLGVLATSRVPLGLLGETTYRLPPLGTDSIESDAVELFVERAGLDRSTDRSAVVDLCTALDGLPLAIELAATRARVLSPAEIAERIGRSVGVVSTRDPTLPDRQRSLDRLLDWTIDLLGRGEQMLLTRLAVIADSFDVSLAEAVGGDDELTISAIPELTWSLVDWSLVTKDSGSGTARYSLLSTVRSHVLERADEAELAAARRRLAARLLTSVGPGRQLTRQWVADMRTELDNVRAVVDDLAISDETARALAWSIGQYHDVRSLYRSGIGEIRRCTERRPTPGPDLIALLTLQADLHLRLGEVAEARALTERAADVASHCGRPWWDDVGLERTEGELALRTGDPAAAADIAARALEAGPATPRSEARLWNLAAIARHDLGDVVGAADALDQGLRAEHEAGLETFLAGTHGNYAEVLFHLGDRSGAARHQLASLEYARSTGQVLQIAFSCMVAARFALDEGNPAGALLVQSGADETLEREGYSLYDTDARLRRELLDGARSTLAPREAAAAVAKGRATPLDRLADHADAILRRQASTPSPSATGG